MKTPLVREKLTLRLPTNLHRGLTSAAVENGRSLNGEIVQRLRRSFEESLDSTTAAAVIDIGAAPVKRREK
jgi:hypothetical protein